MIYDPELLDKLSEMGGAPCNADVYRVTRALSDPVAFSNAGGRWAPADGDNGGTPVLYTSMERKGAIAEVASYLVEMVPPPKCDLKLARIAIEVNSAITLTERDLRNLGIKNFESRETYGQTQIIGAAAAFMEFDGLIAPSARWDCQNLVIFDRNRSMDSVLQVVDEVDLPYEEWSSIVGR